MRQIERRLAAIEARQPAATSSPAQMREAMAQLGIDAPAPVPGETLPDWLTRVPDAALEALMRKWDDGHA